MFISKTPLSRSFDNSERVMGIEPTSSAWKADIISHYTTPAKCHIIFHSQILTDKIRYGKPLLIPVLIPKLT